MEPSWILLAEEDAAVCAFLTDNLAADGYRVLVADDKPAALELLESRRPDLVISTSTATRSGCSTASASRTGWPAGSQPTRR